MDSPQPDIDSLSISQQLIVNSNGPENLEPLAHLAGSIDCNRLTEPLSCGGIANRGRKFVTWRARKTVTNAIAGAQANTPIRRLPYP
jgi:hypothetical protein